MNSTITSKQVKDNWIRSQRKSKSNTLRGDPTKNEMAGNGPQKSIKMKKKNRSVENAGVSSTYNRNKGDSVIDTYRSGSSNSYEKNIGDTDNKTNRYASNNTPKASKNFSKKGWIGLDDMRDGDVCGKVPEEIATVSSPVGSTKSSDSPRMTYQAKPIEIQMMSKPRNFRDMESYIEAQKKSFVPQSTPKQKLQNLHIDLAACSWDNLKQQLEFLSHNSTQALPTIGTIFPEDGATVLHTVSWKAPSSLALMVINMIPASDEGKELFTMADLDGNTPLHLCCANLSPYYDPNTVATSTYPFLDLSVLELLLEKAPEALNVQNCEGDSPLHLLLSSPAISYSNNTSSPHALEDDSLKAVKRLLDCMPSPEIIVLQDKSGATPLHLALAMKAYKSVLSALLEAAPEVCEVEDNDGMVPLHYVAAMLDTPASIVNSMLEIYPHGVCHTTQNGDSPLHLAVRNAGEAQSQSRPSYEYRNQVFENMRELDKNTKEVLGLLIGDSRHFRPEDEKNENGGDRTAKDKVICPLSILNREQLTPLHCCALFNAPPKFTTLLMQHPHSVKAATLTNSFGATALHMAVAQRGAGAAVYAALAVGTPEAALVQDKLKRTPLHVAAQNIHASKQLIEDLVKLNPLGCTKKTERGHLPLHLAAQSQAKEHIIEALLAAFPAGAEVKNKTSNTPLHEAAKYRASVGVVERILKQFPEAVYIQNQFGNLPLHCATAYQAPSDVVGLLLKAWPHGASIQNRNEDCPLHYAAAYATSTEALKLLVDAAPASVILLNSNGQSPIAKAKANEAPEDIITMLERAGDEWTRKTLEDGWGDYI